MLTMNTRAATLFEGIANNAILMAHGVTEVEQLPDKDLQIGVLLALLQDDAKNQSSYLTWGERHAAGRSRRNAAPRFPGVRRARRQTLRRLGTPSAAGPHVSAGLSRRHREGRRAAAHLSCRSSSSRNLSDAMDWSTSSPWNRFSATKRVKKSGPRFSQQMKAIRWVRWLLQANYRQSLTPILMASIASRSPWNPPRLAVRPIRIWSCARRLYRGAMRPSRVRVALMSWLTRIAPMAPL